MRLIPACFAHALQRCTSRLCMNFILIFQYAMDNKQHLQPVKALNRGELPAPCVTVIVWCACCAVVVWTTYGVARAWLLPIGVDVTGQVPVPLVSVTVVPRTVPTPLQDIQAHGRAGRTVVRGVVRGEED